MNRRRVGIAVGVAILVIAVGAAWTAWPRDTNEVSHQDALASFRDPSGASRGEGGEPSATRPAPGVYSYRATGQEEVKLGPLPAEARPFPDTISAVVVDQDDGCFALTISFFAEHTEETRYCTDGSGGLTLDGHTKHQAIGPLTPTATMDCDPAELIAPDGEATSLRCTLRIAGGPKDLTARLTGTTATGAAEELTVDGEPVTVTPTTVTYEVDGDLAGTWVETLWFNERLLPVRIERTLDLSGPATFSERSELEVVDLTPAT